MHQKLYDGKRENMPQGIVHGTGKWLGKGAGKGAVVTRPVGMKGPKNPK